VRRFLSFLHEPGDVFELRAPKYGRFRLTGSGYFDNIEDGVTAVERWDGRANLYVTLNPVAPALLARAHNRFLERADATTADTDVLRRNWLFIDIDPVRASGISSTDVELAAAEDVTEEIARFLADSGWPAPAIAMSGNGYYLLYRIDLPNDDEAKSLVPGVLNALGGRFDTAEAKVDTSVGNASRIIGLVGTLKVKGDSLPERPHRRSELLDVPESVVAVPRARLEALAGSHESSGPTAGARTSTPLSVREMLDARGIEYREQPPDANGVTWLHLPQCPFHDDGRPFECGVGQKLPDGPYAGHCFHPEGEGKGWRDFKRALGLDTGHADHRAIVSPERPRIITTGRFRRDIAADAWSALLASPHRPRLYCHGREVALVGRDPETGSALIEHLSLPTLAGHVDRAADFIRITQSGECPARPPDDVIKDMQAMEKPLQVIRGVVGTPVFTRDGVLCTDPGYQEATRLFYDPIGEPVPPVPHRPDETDVRRAKSLLAFEWLGDFPFTEDASRANLIAAPLTAIARELIVGQTPLFAIDAPAAGTGKGLLVDGIAILTTGRPSAVMPDTRSEEELRKKLTAKLCEGQPLIIIDNLKRTLDSGVLAAALTAPVWSDRILGRTAIADLPVRNLWLVTGNNLKLSDEISRRTVYVRIDSGRDRPFERQSFRHADLPEWLRHHRHEVVWALLVLVQHWLASGRPPWRGTALGSFEPWSRVVGGILETAGFAGFLDNRENLYSRSDAVTEEWRRFTAAWWEEHEARPVVAALLVAIAQDILPSVFEKAKDGASDRVLATRLGKALAQQRDRRFGDLFIKHLGTDGHSKATLWALEVAPPEDSLADVVPDEPPSSADFPHENGAVSDSIAEDAEDADMDSAVQRNVPAPITENGTSPDSAIRHPQHPHLPQTDSKSASETAEDVRKTEPALSDHPHTSVLAPCRGGCGTIVPEGQKCSPCADAGVAEWKATR